MGSVMLLLALMGCGSEEEATETELWDSPGAENTASWAASEALAGCQEHWNPDAHIVSVFRVPDTSWSVVAFSETDPGRVCRWSAYINFDAAPDIELLSTDEYDPGFSYSASDEMTGWAIDSDQVMADLGLSEHAFFWLTPASHRRQVDYEAELEGHDDDAPVILAAEGMTGPEYFLVDGRTGALLSE